MTCPDHTQSYIGATENEGRGIAAPRLVNYELRAIAGSERFLYVISLVVNEGSD